MFELKILQDKTKTKSHINQLDILKNVFESLSPLLDTLNITFTPQGIHILTMDSRNVCYCDFNISSELFSSYRCDKDLIVGVKLKSLLYTLRNVRTEDFTAFSISCEDENAKTLNVIVNMDSSKMMHNIQLYQLQSEDYNLPPMEFLGEVKMSVEKFLSAAKSMDGDYTDVTIEKDIISFYSKSENIDSKYDISASEDVKIVSSDSISRQIATKYINCMIKCANLTESAEIMIGRKTAVVFVFNLMGMGHLSYYVAPNDTDGEDDFDEEL
ncbi:Proliferating cell nuclear antigen [Cucumispora dikerogammari]|nr:Proliferating cell nuclear antigen [Cucumispora dikerogammari]